VADVEAVLTRLDHAAESVDGSAHGLRRSARSGSWQGAAASAFRSDSAAVAGGLDETVTALRTASRAVSAWQSQLVANQREADELEAQARALRANPGRTPEQQAAQTAALDRVLDRADRLQAGHLRQATAAAAALRSATGPVPGWPATGTGRHAGRVSWWTGEVAAGLSLPVWPPAGPAPGVVLPGMPGEEGGPAVPVAGLPGMPGPDDPGSTGVPLGDLLPPGTSADQWPGLPAGTVADQWPGLPGDTVPAVPDLGTGELPVHGQATTSAAGWLDTGHAPAVRPSLDHLPGHRPLDPGLAGHTETSRGEPASGPAHRHVAADAPAREVSRARPVIQHTNNPDVHREGDREGAARSGGRGGGEGGPVRHAAASAPAGGPHGPGGVVDPPAHHGPAGSSPTPTGTPPPQPAPPVAENIGQTVEQQAGPAPDPGGTARPDPGRAIDPGRPDPVRAPEPARLPDPGRAVPATPALPPSAPADAARGLEPGRTTGVDPNPRQAAPATGPGQHAAKGRDDDTSAFLFGPLPADPDGQPVPAGGLRAFLMTRPEARPVLVLIKPGGSGEPLFLTGLTPCASPLPGCAARVPAPGPTTVY